MDYSTLKEASQKWCVSSRMINYYCSKGHYDSFRARMDSFASIYKSLLLVLTYIDFFNEDK